MENATLRTSGGQGSLAEENRYLRSQLMASQSTGVPYNILEELERLKEENNLLRRDTIQMLKSNTPRK